MENKLKVYPIMLPAKSNKGVLWKTWNSDKLSCTVDADDIEEFYHLYFCSDREIKEGDWFIYGDKPTRLDKGTGEVFSKRIEATTDKSLGLPLIPESFVKEWVEKQGKIEYVYIKMTNRPPMMSTNLGEFIPSENANGEVIILPTKDSWNREELKAELFRLWEPGDYPLTFDEWFDKNY